MMWFKILKFELAYRKSRPATYLYFVILFLISFLAISTDTVQIGGGTGLVKENAPTTIATMMVIISAFFMMITSAIMGVGVLRDYDHQMDSILFSTPISKFDYLIGRFLGSFIVVLFAFSGSLFGFIMGEFMPWREAEKMLPFDFYNYLQPFLLLVLPNLFFTAVLFFFTGALTRKIMVVYVQWIFLFVFYQVAVIITSEIDNRELAALIDPFALNTVNVVTQYWTVAEQNSLTVPAEGLVLANRLLWVGISLALGIIGYFSFTFNVVRRSWFKRKSVEEKKTTNTGIAVPIARASYGMKTSLQQLSRQSVFYFKQVLKSVPFQAMVLCGFALLIINSFYIGTTFGVTTFPTTYLMLELITGGFSLFFLIILVTYAGELVWKERDARMNLIYDALPISDFIGLVAKFIGMMLVYVVLIFLLIIFGITVQALKGYYEFNIGVYLTTLFTDTFSFLLLFTLLALFIQVMVNHKFIGYAVTIIFFISLTALELWGVEHDLFQFGSADLGPYSEMNGYGHFFTSFTWFDLYWTGFSIFLFGLAVMFASRGAESIMRIRWRISKYRLTRPMLTLIITSFLVFGLSGCYIFYNTNVLNTYRNSDESDELRANYEKALKKYEDVAQPKITGINMKVELYPKDRDYTAEGYYTLVNMEPEAVEEIHVQLNGANGYGYDFVRFDRESKVKENFKDFAYIIYQLDEPLAPGDSMRMEFKTWFNSKGFVESGSNTSVIFNGTFFNNSEFPGIGYAASYELSQDDDRKDYDLEPKERMMKRDNPKGWKENFITEDSHGIDFEIVIGTEADQIAVAPGYLQKEWEDEGRKYYHYKMDQKMLPFFNIVSARYEVMRDKMTIDLDSLQKEINLEIYYHKGHEYNLESMMKAMKHSFKYFSENFSPYQYSQMRILEFPRYASFAQSFANTVPFSEGIGFMVDTKDNENVDIAYFVTAHELAHQWWGHQLIPASVQGGGVLSESLSQYSALMVMKQKYPQEHMQEFLKEELNRYLSGRANEQKKELPLALSENQSYIHYGKGANVMYALQDYIGEDSVNTALSRLVNDWGGYEKNKRYPTTVELVNYLRKVTPDSLQYLITDMFDKIIIYENKIENASYQKVDDDRYQVKIALDTRKLEADSIGYTNEVALSDWIDIGIYGVDENGDEKFLYLQKHKITDQEQVIEVEVDAKPSRAGIDPLYMLIDRNPNDNIKAINEEVIN